MCRGTQQVSLLSHHLCIHSGAQQITHNVCDPCSSRVLIRVASSGSSHMMIYLVAKEGQPKRDVAEAIRKSWLTFDDRRTAGIPGLFPLILNLPIRFTQEPDSGDRLKGVFTNARGWIRGWTLADTEQQRVDASNDHELALLQRPLRLFIEMASANPSLELIDDRRIYTLRQHRKPWYKDGEARQVEVQRFGYPIVPDFGGTAHSYCGSSLDACIGDLLDWWQKPQRDGAVRG